MSFIERLEARWRSADSLLCVGLDPDLARIPASVREGSEPLFAFCRAIVDACADLVCAFKPQIAYFSAVGAETQLERLIAHIHDRHPDVPVILDAKRGDMSATAQQYAREVFDRYRADAVTLSPFLGRDSIEPYLDYADRGAFLLCRTSNPGGADLQGLRVEGVPIYEHIARLVADHWNRTGQLGLVVGATYPAELARVRAIVGDMPLLIPGIGAQGGDVAATVAAGRTNDATGMIISSSRAILYADPGPAFASAARHAAALTRDEINQARAQVRPPAARASDRGSAA